MSTTKSNQLNDGRLGNRATNNQGHLCKTQGLDFHTLNANEIAITQQ